MSNVGSAVSATQVSLIGSVEKLNQSDQNFIQTATSTSSRSSTQYEAGDQQSHQNIQLLQSTETQDSALINSGISIGLTQTQTVVNSGLISSNSNLVTSTSSSSNQLSESDSNLAPATKRVKLSDDSDIINDPVALEKAILEYNFMKLKSIKSR